MRKARVRRNSSHFLKLQSYFNLSIHPSVYHQSIATSLTCPPTHFPLTSSFNFIIIPSPSPLRQIPPTILLPSNYPPYLTLSASSPPPHTLDPLVFSFNHNSFPEIPPPRARAIYLPPCHSTLFSKYTPSFLVPFPCPSLAKPLSTELLHPLCVILTPLPASFLPVYAPFLFISADACVSADTSPSPSISPTSLHVSVHKDGTCLP